MNERPYTSTQRKKTVGFCRRAIVVYISSWCDGFAWRAFTDCGMMGICAPQEWCEARTDLARICEFICAPRVCACLRIGAKKNKYSGILRGASHIFDICSSRHTAPRNEFGIQIARIHIVPHVAPRLAASLYYLSLSGARRKLFIQICLLLRRVRIYIYILRSCAAANERRAFDICFWSSSAWCYIAACDCLSRLAVCVMMYIYIAPLGAQRDRCVLITHKTRASRISCHAMRTAHNGDRNMSYTYSICLNDVIWRRRQRRWWGLVARALIVAPRNGEIYIDFFLCCVCVFFCG